MEAKETVMKKEEMLKAMQTAYEFTKIVEADIDKGVEAVAQAQAKISFKMGYNQALQQVLRQKVKWIEGKPVPVGKPEPIKDYDTPNASERRM